MGRKYYVKIALIQQYCINPKTQEGLGIMNSVPMVLVELWKLRAKACVVVIPTKSLTAFSKVSCSTMIILSCLLNC